MMFLLAIAVASGAVLGRYATVLTVLPLSLFLAVLASLTVSHLETSLWMSIGIALIPAQAAYLVVALTKSWMTADAPFAATPELELARVSASPARHP